MSLLADKIIHHSRHADAQRPRPKIKPVLRPIYSRPGGFVPTVQDLTQGGWQAILPSVRTTTSSKGQVIIPQQVRARLEIRPGDDFLVFELSNGDILLRRSRPPRKSLAWHLRRMQGLDLKRGRERVREVSW